MQVTETLNSGLKREIKVTVPAGDMEAKLMSRLNDVKNKVRINGFRPGKVPIPHLRKMYGKSFMAEVVNDILSNQTRHIIADRGEKAAMQPEVTMTEDEKQAEKILAGGADFEFQLAYEVIPAIEIQDLSGISVTRQLYDVPDEEVEEQVRRVAESTRSYEATDEAAAEGCRVTIDYVGRIDGEAFEGGSGSGQPLVLGSKEFVPGFEEQLIGARAGDEKSITVTFPENYTARNLAGKEATFDVTVKEVGRPAELRIDDETAKSLGVDSLARLRDVVRGQMESQFGGMTRQKLKRQLLDQLDAGYKFEAPSKLVEAEFSNIWTQVNRDLTTAGRTFADEDTSEDAARAEYMKLAERRVRLGLVLAEIGEKAGVVVAEDEVQRALFENVRRFPANQQQEVFEFYRNNPNALTALRAPLFEEKVIDHLLTKIAVTDVKVSKEELMAEDEEGVALQVASEGGATPAVSEAGHAPADTPQDRADDPTAQDETGEPRQKGAAGKKASARSAE